MKSRRILRNLNAPNAGNCSILRDACYVTQRRPDIDKRTNFSDCYVLLDQHGNLPDVQAVL
jgi:hypothetical protein